MLKPIPLIEDVCCGCSQRHSDAEHKQEGQGVTFPGQGHVHSIKGGHCAWQADNDRECCERLHYAVQVVGDDRGKGIHHAREDLGGDGGHLDGLLVLSEHILEQVLILLIIIEKLCALDAFHHHLIGTQGGRKVGETFLEFKQLEHLAV